MIENCYISNTFDPWNYFAKEGEKGMTATSANKLANLAKERNREDMLFVDSVRFYSDVMTLMVNPGEPLTLSEGFEGTPEMMKRIKEALLRTARYNAFISWVREAINAKDDLIHKVKSSTVRDWCKDQGIEYPPLEEDDYSKILNERRATAQVSIDGMVAYYMAEAKASVIGKAVHPDGPIDVARRNLIDAQLNPTVREGSGQDTVIIKKIPTASNQEVNDFYMELQALWRQAESEVNANKSEWDSKNNEMKMEYLNDYSERKRAFENEASRIQREWEKWKLEEVKRIGKLKIRIPSLLQPVLDELLALGK